MVIKWIQTLNSFFLLLKQTRKHIWQFSFFVIIICTFGLSESRSDGWGATSEAFIFSLKNSEGLAPFVSKVKKEYTGKAIRFYSGYAVVFGDDVSIPDFDTRPSRFSTSFLGFHYSLPPAVKDQRTVLAGRRFAVSTDEVEVFYLDPSP